MPTWDASSTDPGSACYDIILAPFLLFDSFMFPAGFFSRAQGSKELSQKEDESDLEQLGIKPVTQEDAGTAGISFKCSPIVAMTETMVQ